MAELGCLVRRGPPGSDDKIGGQQAKNHQESHGPFEGWMMQDEHGIKTVVENT